MNNIFCLLGGYNNKSLIHFRLVTDGVLMLHFGKYDPNEYSYAERSFVIYIGGKDHEIFADEIYPIEFAREVWTHFTNLKFEDGKYPNNFTKYVPYMYGDTVPRVEV